MTSYYYSLISMYKYILPLGFDDGYIKWDDENKLPSANSATGTLPDGVYDIDTTVYYCCR